MSAEHLKPERREFVIDAIMLAPTFAVAAERAGVCERTLRRYLSDQAFRADVDRARREFALAIRARTVDNAMKAQDVLRRILDSETASNRDLIAAARETLELFKSERRDDIEARLEALEARDPRTNAN